MEYDIERSHKVNQCYLHNKAVKVEMGKTQCKTLKSGAKQWFCCNISCCNATWYPKGYIRNRGRQFRWWKYEIVEMGVGPGQLWLQI